jgi:pantoate--beta-alanine ligase
LVTLIHSSHEFTHWRTQTQDSVGFVPTMGNLHKGHISLLMRALEENEVVVFSIFVNPKQFGPQEDFNRYPRTLDEDLKLIEACTQHTHGKSVIVYAPKDASEVFGSQNDQTIRVAHLNSTLEGAWRPGHFDGVATVVYRLFDLVRPKNAYFGLKDYQQFILIRQMVKDLQLPISIVGMPIIRDDSGLALSSRNQYLTKSERAQAIILPQTLKEIASLIKSKRANISLAQEKIAEILDDKRWNYLELRDAENLSQDIQASKSLTLLGVFQIGTTRLLDNMQLEIE